MRGRAGVAGALFLTLAGCGYVGPVLPPSPELPPAITDLSVVERGDTIDVVFTTPPRTVDGLPIRDFSNVDLRVGPSVAPFDFDHWAAGARPYDIEPPAGNDPDNPQPFRISKTIPASEWIGKRVTVAVRTSVKRKDHFSSWSNRVTLEVVAPLEPPSLKAASTAKGVLLSWHPMTGATEYRIYRKDPGTIAPAQIGTSQEAMYLDTTAEYETPYEYTAIAAAGLAESLPSRPSQISAKDVFPPSVPASITALASPASIEVSWQRSPESDLKGYFLYRSADNGRFERVGRLLTLPAYSDRNVEHGKTYRYEVSAVDRNNNESDKSAPASVVF